MVDDELSAVAPKAFGVVGGSGGKPGRCFASVAGPQADDTRAPAIALGTTRSTINALRTPKDREKTAHTTANALRTAHATAKTAPCRSPIINHRSHIGSRLRTNAFTLPKQRGPESVRGFTLPQQRDPESVRGFTLVELSVTMGVLVLLVLLFTQLLNSAATITILGHKQMDADSQARQLLDRMTIDFAQMVKRPDVDYYLKSLSGAASDCGVCGVHDQDGWTGNDQAAFYSTVPGYYAVPTPTPAGSPIGASPVSLVSYRINLDSTSSSYNKLERMGKGLAWNGFSSSMTPVVFLPQTIGGPQPAGGNWPAAVSSSTTDSSYEVIGPQVFRFEYYYLLKGQTAPTNAPTPTPTPYGSMFSDTPWDTNAGHTNVGGMRDIAAIVVVIAAIDPRSKVLLDNSAQVPPPNDNITLLGAQLIDWRNTTCPGCATLACPTQQEWQTTPGLLRAQWQCVLNAIIANGGRIGNTSTFLPLGALPGIRVYERYFYLNQ